MRAMVLDGRRGNLQLRHQAAPSPGSGQIQLRVAACAVCRTDLHIIDGELPKPKADLIPGHEIVGYVTMLGDGVTNFGIGDRVGVPWLGHTCGTCKYCLAGTENLCLSPLFTGYDIDGGFAEMAVADARYCFPIPMPYDDISAAPLLCAGLIGYRAYMMTADAHKIGFYGFGAAAHILAQVARYEGRQVFAFTQRGDLEAQKFAHELGATWSGASDEVPPEELDAAIIFAPVGGLVPSALKALRRGGCVICAGIHMSDIPSFPYRLLWQERSIRSVANLTRNDGDAFLRLAPLVPVTTKVQVYPLEEANKALADLRDGKLEGAAVIVP
ncbi:MAG: zinc-binding alcohol dehydrogenase family protein [Rhodospirillaceae bacterium]|nr:MAG: zinc-binding alcohol dehydrogenase family protein [Rhodospirillaceae bacterium]